MPSGEQRSPVTPMGTYEDCLWPANPGAYGRAARQGGRYRAFIPNPIAGRSFLLDGEAGALLHNATKALEHLERSSTRVATLGAVAQNLLRSESVASSRIEGVAISQKSLAWAAHREIGNGRGDSRAAAVLGNVEAMKRAIAIGAKGEPIVVGDLIDIHRLLLRHTEDSQIAGVIREAQNWIGGNDYNPVGAVYVPPPAERVPELLSDLCDFIDRDDLSPIAQAAIAHAQFETIHPFADGNGRAGRALVYAVLRKRGEIPTYVPPISLVLGARPKSYIAGLTDYREGEVQLWCGSFSHAVARAAGEAERLAEAIEELQERWLVRLGRLRKDAAARQLVSALPEQPVSDACVLRRLNARMWGRVWECDERLHLV